MQKEDPIGDVLPELRRLVFKTDALAAEATEVLRKIGATARMSMARRPLHSAETERLDAAGCLLAQLQEHVFSLSVSVMESLEGSEQHRTRLAVEIAAIRTVLSHIESLE